MNFLNLFFTKRCNLRCYRGRDGYSCIAGCNRPSADLKTEPAIDDIIAWTSMFTPGVPVHVTGGEPCMREDLTELIERLLINGHKVSLDTNGTLLCNHTGLNDMPIAYHVTWHRAQVTKEEFVCNLKGYEKSRMLISSVIPQGTEPPFNLSDELGINAWSLKWIVDRTGYHGEKPAHRSGGPNDSMIFIGQGGEIFPCSKPYETYGSIYDLSFDVSKSKSFRCPERNFPCDCYALRTAELMCELHETL